jgi:hypothetical protein
MKVSCPIIVEDQLEDGLVSYVRSQKVVSTSSPLMTCSCPDHAVTEFKFPLVELTHPTEGGIS